MTTVLEHGFQHGVWTTGDIVSLIQSALNGGATITLTGQSISGGTINNASVGATTRSSGAFTTLAANGAVTLTNASLTLSAIPTADPHVAGRVWANSGVLTVSAG